VKDRYQTVMNIMYRRTDGRKKYKNPWTKKTRMMIERNVEEQEPRDTGFDGS
jgi:hypothetical protein